MIKIQKRIVRPQKFCCSMGRAHCLHIYAASYIHTYMCIYAYRNSVKFDIFLPCQQYIFTFMFTYLSVQGLERIVVRSGCSRAAPTAAEGSGAEAGTGAVVTPQLRHKIEKLALELLKMENEKFSIPALKLLLSCMYVGEYQNDNHSRKCAAEEVI